MFGVLFGVLERIIPQMTVKELFDELQRYDPELLVAVDLWSEINRGADYSEHMEFEIQQYKVCEWAPGFRRSDDGTIPVLELR